MTGLELLKAPEATADEIADSSPRPVRQLSPPTATA